MKLWMLMSILGTFLVVGCGRPEEKEVDPDKLQKLDYSKDVIGSWKGECIANPDSNFSAKMVQIHYTFNGTSFVERHYAFESDDCSGQPSYVMRKIGNYSVLDDRDQDKPDAPRQINITRSGTDITPNNGVFTDYLNTNEVCGISDWVIGRARPVGGRLCWGTIPYPNSVRYDIFSLLDDDKKLCFGKIDDPVNNGTKASLRPQGLGPCFDLIPSN